MSNSDNSPTTPMWRGDGRELFYLEGHTMMSVELQFMNQTVVAGPPRSLFDVAIEDQERRNRFVVSKDGQRFLVLVLNRELYRLRRRA